MFYYYDIPGVFVSVVGFLFCVGVGFFEILWWVVFWVGF
jgi:hypothetical protein